MSRSEYALSDYQPLGRDDSYNVERGEQLLVIGTVPFCEGFVGEIGTVIDSWNAGFRGIEFKLEFADGSAKGYFNSQLVARV